MACFQPQSPDSASGSEESDSDRESDTSKHAPSSPQLKLPNFGKIVESVDKAYKPLLEAKEEAQKEDIKVAWGRNREGIKQGTFLRRGPKKEVTWRTPQSMLSSGDPRKDLVTVTIIGADKGKDKGDGKKTQFVTQSIYFLPTEIPKVQIKAPIMIPPVAPLPKMDTWTRINHNILGKDENALRNMPWLGDDKLDSNPEFYANLVQTYDGKIHDELGGKVKKELDDQMLVEVVSKVSGKEWTGAGKDKLPSEVPDILVFEAISKYFDGTQGTSKEIKLRYLNLTGLQDSSADKDKPKEVKILDYACQRCGLMMFCDLHPNKPNPDGKLGNSYQRVPEDEADEEMDEDKKPCGDNCYMHLKGKKMKKSKDSDWTETEIADFKEALSIFYKEKDFDPCLFVILIQPSTKTCAQVYSFGLTHRTEYLNQLTEQQSQSDPLPNVPGCSKNMNTQKKKASFFWAKHADKDKTKYAKTAFVHPYEPCNHPGKSCDDSDCNCKKTQNFCQKYCYCGDKCDNQFPGCRCGTGKCSTNLCPCFCNGRECDTSLCGPCEATSEDPSSIRCKNQSIQRRQHKRVLVGPSDLDGGIGVVGYGVFLKEPALKDDLIDEYCGELISHEEANRRGKIYDAKRRHFMFELDKKYVIDSYRFGNEMRFVNHSSKNPNCHPKVMMVGGDHRIGIYALHDIQIGDELLFDYEQGSKMKHLNFDEVSGMDN